MRFPAFKMQRWWQKAVVSCSVIMHNPISKRKTTAFMDSLSFCWTTFWFSHLSIFLLPTTTARNFFSVKSWLPLKSSPENSVKIFWKVIHSLQWAGVVFCNLGFVKDKWQFVWNTVHWCQNTYPFIFEGPLKTTQWKAKIAYYLCLQPCWLTR